MTAQHEGGKDHDNINPPLRCEASWVTLAAPLAPRMRTGGSLMYPQTRGTGAPGHTEIEAIVKLD